MPKIDYNELFSVQQIVQQARLAILDQFSPFNSTIQEFSGENELTGDSWDSAKSYLTQIPPVSTGVFNALSEVGETLGNYLSSFQAEVGSPKNQLDTDKLQDLNTRLKSLNAQKEACLEAMRKSAKLVTYGPGQTLFGTSYVDMGNTSYENAIEDVEKDIEILEKYETFESSHGSDFSAVKSALTQLKTGLAELKRDVSFDSSTGNFSKLSLKDKEWYQAVEEYNKDQPTERFEMVKTYKEKFREDGTLLGYEVVYNVYVNGVLNVDRTNKMTEVMREAQWGEMSTFVLEVTGVNDFRRYFSGFDPITGEKLTGNQQALSGLIGLMSAISTYEAAKMLVNLQKGYAMMQGVDIADDLAKAKISPNQNVYQYNMVENPGPLVDIDIDAAGTFTSGKYNVSVLEEKRILYRAGNAENPLGQYFTTEIPESAAKVRIESAVKNQWIDKTGALTGTSDLTTIYAVEFPKGTTIYTGPVGYQGGINLGGGEQIFIPKPWNIDGVGSFKIGPLK